MRCKKKNKILVYIFSIFSQITLIFTFLIIFYFNYVELVEKKTFLHQIDQVLDELVKPIRSKIPKSNAVKLGIDALVVDIKTENSKSDKTTKQNNQNLAKISMNMVYGCIGGFLIYTLVVTLTKNCLPLKSVLLESVIALLFIALTEYLFLQIVIANYKSADPNYVKRTIAKAIETFAKKKS